MIQPGMLIVRAGLCTACKRCMVYCAVAHSESKELEGAMAQATPPQPRVVVKPLGDGAAPYQCRHCEDPPCVPTCPSDALTKDVHPSRVVLDDAKCAAAGKCVKRCPFLGIFTGTDGQAVKCDLCIERLEQGLLPACAEACPTGAIVYKRADKLTDDEKAHYAGTPGAALVWRTGVTYSIDPDLCIACRKCALACPAGAVKGEKKVPHEIIQDRCVQCGACYANCPVDAIQAAIH